MSFDETLGKSRALDQFLKGAVSSMPITDGEPILSISELVADIKAAKNEMRGKIQKELKGMAADIRANSEVAVQKIQVERKAIRDELTDMLGNEIVDTSQDPS